MININNFNYEEKYKYLTNICLNLTDQCNLRCKYCFTEWNPHYMSLQTAKKAIDWVYNNLQIKIKNNWIEKDHYFCEVNFFGGEPMLMYDSIIVPLIEYTKEKYKNSFQFGITTNVTLLNKERLEFFKNNNVFILLSIDGDKETQDYNRPCADGSSSYNLIKDNIQYILQYYPEITFRSTVYHETVDKLFHNYCFAENLGFKHYFFVPDQRNNWSKDELDILKEQVNLIYNYRLNQIINHISPMQCSNIDNFLCQTIKSLYFTNKVMKQQYKYNSVDRCGLGTNSGGIGYDGSIWGCQEQATHSNENNLFYLGNIYKDGIEKEKHLKLLIKYAFSKTPINEKKQCQTCKLRNICIPNISCPSVNNEIFNDPGYISDIECFFHNLYYENSLILLNTLVYIEDKEIQQYLYTYYYNTAKLVK